MSCGGKAQGGFAHQGCHRPGLHVTSLGLSFLVGKMKRLGCVIFQELVASLVFLL